MRKLEKHNGHVFISILLLAATLILMFMLKNCSNKNYSKEEQKPSGGDTIDVAIEYSPLSLYTYNDTLGGFNYDVLRMIAQKKNVLFKYHPIVTLTKTLDGLKNGNYDIVVADLPKTTEYKDSFLYTDPIYLDKQVLVQLKDSITGKSKINSPLDLAQDTVWVVAGASFATRISNLADEIGDTIYTIEEPLYASEQLFLMVAIGEIRYAVVNEMVAKTLAKEYPQIDISTNVSFTQFQPWVLNSNNQKLCDSLNVWLNSMKDSKEYRALQKRYFR